MRKQGKNEAFIERLEDEFTPDSLEDRVVRLEKQYKALKKQQDWWNKIQDELNEQVLLLKNGKVIARR